MTEPRYGLTDEQMALLLSPLHPGRVQKDDRGMSHLAGWDVRRWLTRIFGPVGWADKTLSTTLVHESEITLKNGRPGWKVIYLAETRLTVKSIDGVVLTTFEDGAVGDANLPDLAQAHDMAFKTALTQSLKRCAVNLGDQFGMSLYNKGATDAVVIRTAVWNAPDGSTAADTMPPADDVQGDEEIEISIDDDYSPPIGVDAEQADAVLFHALKRQTETATTIAELRKAGDRVKEEVKRLTPGQIKELQKAWRDTNVLLIMDAIDGRLEKLRQGDLPATRSIYTEIEKQIDDAGFTVDVTADLKKQLNQAFDEAVEAASAPPPQ